MKTMGDFYFDPREAAFALTEDMSERALLRMLCFHVLGLRQDIRAHAAQATIVSVGFPAPRPTDTQVTRPDEVWEPVPYTVYNTDRVVTYFACPRCKMACIVGFCGTCNVKSPEMP